MPPVLSSIRDFDQYNFFAKETETIASERFLMAKQRYILGTISFLEFSNAQQQKDAAVTTYINNLFLYWRGYYLLRRMTLYDFNTHRDLSETNFQPK